MKTAARQIAKSGCMGLMTVLAESPGAKNDSPLPHREAKHGWDAVEAIMVSEVSGDEDLRAARIDTPPAIDGKAKPIRLRQIGRSRRGLAGEPPAKVRHAQAVKYSQTSSHSGMMSMGSSKQAQWGRISTEC